MEVSSTLQMETLTANNFTRDVKFRLFRELRDALIKSPHEQIQAVSARIFIINTHRVHLCLIILFHVFPPFPIIFEWRESVGLHDKNKRNIIKNPSISSARRFLGKLDVIVSVNAKFHQQFDEFLERVKYSFRIFHFAEWKLRSAALIDMFSSHLSILWHEATWKTSSVSSARSLAQSRDILQRCTHIVDRSNTQRIVNICTKSVSSASSQQESVVPLFALSQTEF